mmetsp:Transcript_125190/g.365618  ORF Transcript_125190/g.365618 Transcript_125190/m.365618 type:complete len:138 (-) Transcript_125190:175-588(-)
MEAPELETMESSGCLDVMAALHIRAVLGRALRAGPALGKPPRPLAWRSERRGVKGLLPAAISSPPGAGPKGRCAAGARAELGRSLLLALRLVVSEASDDVPAKVGPHAALSRADEAELGRQPWVERPGERGLRGRVA